MMVFILFWKGKRMFFLTEQAGSGLMYCFLVSLDWWEKVMGISPLGSIKRGVGELQY